MWIAVAEKRATAGGTHRLTPTPIKTLVDTREANSRGYQTGNVSGSLKVDCTTDQGSKHTPTLRPKYLHERTMTVCWVCFAED